MRRKGIQGQLVIKSVFRDKPGSFNEYHLDQNLIDKLNRLIHSDWANEGRAIIYLKGPYGSGKLDTAEKLCHDANLHLLI